jgi:menaquinone-dependent protoporphyrinogen oxidase
MMRILVAYATAHESTKGIAKAIGDRLTQAGLQAEVRALDVVDGLEGYDALVIGSAIHNGVWLPRAAAFVKHWAQTLSIRPVWLFSVSSVGETSSFFGPRMSRFIRRTRKETGQMAGFRTAIRPRDHRNFAGVVRPADWGRFGALFLRLFGGTHGDHRDWRDVEAWAAEIARQLRTIEEADGRGREVHEPLHA